MEGWWQIMSELRSYQDLIAWQKSMVFAQKIYSSTRGFPREETYGLISQLRRASVLISCNIAEGQGRNTTGGVKQILGGAKSSAGGGKTFLMLSSKFKVLARKNPSFFLGAAKKKTKC